MKKILMLLICGTLALSFNVYAEETVRFDFQEYIAEGAYEFYRIEVDLKNKSGTLCYFENDGFVAAGGKLDKISEDTIWSQYINFAKVKPACAKFGLYNSLGWFMADSFKLGETEYRYFFIGSIKKEKIDGKLYQFRDHRPSKDNRSYKTADQMLLSVNASHK